jgi:hypothetical protein
VVTALLLLAAFLLQGTWALAGTTGGLNGTVTDENGAAVSSATVTVTSASQQATTSTDAGGHYVFLNLAPDTYTISVSKDNFNTASLTGVTVFADNNFTQDVHVQSTLKTIAHTTSRAAGNLVKSGLTSDVYSVDAATAEKVAALGGGGNLNQAYSALASQPGVTLGYGGMGWGQTIFIHGSSYSQIGYEYDGIPVNRAFDNYNANTLTNLGQQELQVATGGSPADASASTVGGYINQVIKTGTYPGFGTANLGIGAPAFYHAARVEAGGSTPDRLFSYYVGVLGYDQTFRFLDQFNGGSGYQTQGINTANSAWETFSYNYGGLFPRCNANGSDPAVTGSQVDIGCEGFFNANYGDPSLLADREAVANFHIGIPHRHDAGRDDIQLLYSGSFEHESFQNSINDAGGFNFLNAQGFGGAFSRINWGDAVLPTGLSFGQVIPVGGSVNSVNYLFPSSPQNRTVDSILNYNAEAGSANDSEIFKAQYTHNIGSSAYLRVYGYTFYSDWLENNPTDAGILNTTQDLFIEPVALDYELITHTRGGAVTYANQLNAKNLFTANLTYTTATVSRVNNSTFNVYGSTNPQVTSLTNGNNCYSAATGAVASCFSSSTSGSLNAPAPTAPTGAALAAGATWQATNPTGLNGTANNVTPKFSSWAISDEFRPSDKWLFNIGLRGDRFEYDLTPSSSAAYSFWFNAVANSACYDPASANGPYLQFAKAGGIPVPGSLGLVYTAPGAACPNSPVSGQQMLHPNGSTAAGSGNPAGTSPLLYSNAEGSVYSVSKFEPRFSGTYTQSPDTVWRFSAGAYVNPFNTATVQYLNLSAKAAATFDFQTFFGLGFTTPEHEVQPTTSNNFDLSLERHIRGTDVNFKISPFYRDVTNQTQDAFIGAGFVSAIPTGDEKVFGYEIALQKGDPSRDGLSGQLSYTYTKASMTFNPIGNTGQNFIDQTNGAVAAYNALTHAGSGTTYKTSNGQTITLGTASPCYLAGAADTADCTVTGSTITMTPAGLAAGAVVNPYYFSAAQPYYNTGGSYPVYQTFPAIGGEDADTNMPIVWPNVVAGWLNWKHDRFSITPNFQLIQGYSGGSNGGAQYGGPLSVIGLDPRSCLANQGNEGVANPAYAPLPSYIDCFGSNYGEGFLYIPDPYTGKYDNFGAFENPWLLNVNAQIRYDLSSKVTANLVLSNIYNRCFGGSSTPWSSAFPVGGQVCGYDSNSYFAGTTPGQGFFYGGSPHDTTYNTTPYTPSSYYPYNPLTSFLPFSAYLTFTIKL